MLPLIGSRQRLAGRVVCVTGAARGIGAATAKALAERGALVSIGDVDAGRARITAADLGGGAAAFPLDVTNRSSFERFFERTEAALGPVEVLVNNAGIMPVGRLGAEPDHVTDDVIDVNLRGVILGTKIALERMLPRGEGHIVNVASMAGKVAVPGLATYCATKHAVVGLTEALREELRDSPLDVTLVMPSMVSTELASGVMEGRGLRPVSPQRVAEEIVCALERRRGEIYVPSFMRLAHMGLALLPAPVERLVRRLARDDRALMSLDSAARGDYEERMEHLHGELVRRPLRA